MSDIPRRTAARTAKLASLPLGVAGRAVGGWGRRLVGGDGEEISAQLMAKSAEQLFAVLGELKGGAMKFGQALSVFEAAIPDEYAAPFRESLIKLQTAAPPMPTSHVHRMLAEQFGRGWRARFTEFDETPAAAASIGQVHRGVWHDGRTVAVKVQYPGAGEALRSDLRQLSRMSRVLQPLVPGLEIKPLLAELRDRMEEELDYRDEAANQRAFAAAFADDDKVCVPKVVASAPKAMVTEWVTGRKLSDVIRTGTQAERDDAAVLLAELHYSSPPRAGLLHADPHPGNFQLLDDGRLLVLDFGAVARLPDGLPRPLSIMVRLALENRPDDLLSLLRRRGVRAAGLVHDRRRCDRLPRAVHRAVALGRVPLQPALAAAAGGPGGRSAQPRLPHRAGAEPAAAVPARPPGDDGHPRGALPARRRRPAARHRPPLAAVDLRRGRGGQAELTPTKIAAKRAPSRRRARGARFATIFGWACDGAPAAGEPGRRRLGAARSRSEPGSEQITGALPMVVGRPPWRGAAGMPRRTATVRQLRGWRLRRPSPRPVDSRTGRASATAVRR